MGAVSLLLDTHALLWWLADDPRLDPRARQAIAEPDTPVWVSAASCWEIATKHRLGKLDDPAGIIPRLPDIVQERGMAPLAISPRHALAAGALPGPHRDPFDRMLIAQARMEQLTVVTIDPVFQEYGVPVLGA